mgnify:CR=1 FL=1
MDRMPVVNMPEVEMEIKDMDYPSEIPDELKEEFSLSATEDLLPEEDVLVDESEAIDKPKINNNEIFKYQKGDGDLKVAKVKKPKRVMTEEHKARLQKGRETALKNRRAKAAAKKASVEKPVPDEPEPEPELIHPEFKPEPKPEPEKIDNKVDIIKETQVKKEDMEKMIFDASQRAVEDYEILRKERKKVKKEKELVETERKRVRDTIRKATSIGIDTNNPWANCY